MSTGEIVRWDSHLGETEDAFLCVGCGRRFDCVQPYEWLPLDGREAERAAVVQAMSIVRHWSVGEEPFGTVRMASIIRRGVGLVPVDHLRAMP
jgi:hypothetical protein